MNIGKEVNDYYLNDLKLERVQVDEIWSYIKKKKNLKESDSIDFGDAYSLKAMKPDTKLFISHHEGKRTSEDIQELFKDIEKKRSIQRPFPFLHRTIGVLSMRACKRLQSPGNT